MVKKAEDVYQEALMLPGEERERLLRMLASPLESDFVSPEIEQAWLEEARRRDKAMDESQAPLIPAEEVMRELRERYGV
jgi:hypothetical protein